MQDYKSTTVETACERAVSVEDFKKLARARLPPAIFDYIDSGACDEITSNANRRDLDTIRLLPLSLRDVQELDLSLDLLGHRFSFSVGFSPTAFHELVHEDGEVSSASVAGMLNIPMIVSSMSSIAIEELVARSGNSNLWLQTYIFKDRELTRELVQRAEDSGYKCIVVTTGCPVPGKRDRNIRNSFVLPDNVVAANFRGHKTTVEYNNPIHSVQGADLDPSITWSDVEWLRHATHLPVVLKGIMNPVDVSPALDLDVSGIIVSNHGGRQLDTTESTIRILGEVVAAVAGRIPLLVDGGFRRGTDILKAIALGADAVLLGRPVLWALAVDGQRGVRDLIDLLVEELRIAMQVVGCSSVDALRKNSSILLRM